jgi:hypothetical protein
MIRIKGDAISPGNSESNSPLLNAYKKKVLRAMTISKNKDSEWQNIEIVICPPTQIEK